MIAIRAVKLALVVAVALFASHVLGAQHFEANGFC
jgi:hypothetical protein